MTQKQYDNKVIDATVRQLKLTLKEFRDEVNVDYFFSRSRIDMTDRGYRLFMKTCNQAIKLMKDI